MFDELGHGFNSDRKESRIGLFDGLANRLVDTCGVPENADFIANGAVFRERIEKRKEDAWLILLAQPVVSRIRDDAHDFHVPRIPQVGVAHSLTDGIRMGEERPGERLIDDGDARDVATVFWTDFPS